MNDKPNLQQYPAAKAAFEAWYMEKHQPDFPINPHTLSYWLGQFYVMHFDFQSGVFCAFLREMGVEANAELYDEGEYIARCCWHHPEYDSISGFPVTPHQSTALIAAIEAGFAVVEKGLTEAGNTRQKEQK